MKTARIALALGIIALAGTASAQTLTPDGSYVRGDAYQRALDGSYVTASPQGPQRTLGGGYVAGSSEGPQMTLGLGWVAGSSEGPHLAPDGSYTSGNYRMMPDGSYR